MLQEKKIEMHGQWYKKSFQVIFFKLFRNFEVKDIEDFPQDPTECGYEFKYFWKQLRRFNVFESSN